MEGFWMGSGCFGWSRPDELVRTFGNAPFVEGKPTMVIARTVKEKGYPSWRTKQNGITEFPPKKS